MYPCNLLLVPFATPLQTTPFLSQKSTNSFHIYVMITELLTWDWKMKKEHLGRESPFFTSFGGTAGSSRALRPDRKTIWCSVPFLFLLNTNDSTWVCAATQQHLEKFHMPPTTHLAHYIFMTATRQNNLCWSLKDLHSLQWETVTPSYSDLGSQPPNRTWWTFTWMSFLKKY